MNIRNFVTIIFSLIICIEASSGILESIGNGLNEVCVFLESVVFERKTVKYAKNAFFAFLNMAFGIGVLICIIYAIIWIINFCF